MKAIQYTGHVDAVHHADGSTSYCCHVYDGEHAYPVGYFDDSTIDGAAWKATQRFPSLIIVR